MLEQADTRFSRNGYYSGVQRFLVEMQAGENYNWGSAVPCWISTAVQSRCDIRFVDY